MDIIIKEVITKKDLKKWIKFPNTLYKENEYYVPFLASDEAETFSQTKNPAYAFCETKLFLAYKGDEIVGRIAGLINHAYNKKWNKNAIRFTRFDFIDDFKVSQKLLQKVVDWGKENGLTEIMGPIGFTDMDHEGMLIEGFEEFNLSITFCNHPYYTEHLAYIKNVTRWCLDEDLDLKKRFCSYLSEKYGLYEKCVPVGMSCGGLIGSKFAAKYPECVSALYLDAPVMNLLSCPAGLGKGVEKMFPEFTRATGISLAQLICYREHPIDKMHLLLENNIPVILVYRDSDDIVPYEKNGAPLEKYYRENGGMIVLIGKKNCGHHPTDLQTIPQL